jgi:alpha-amylase
VNHVATTNAKNFQADSTYGPLNVTSRDIHSFCWVEDYTNQTQVETCWLGDENVALADVNTEDPSVVSTFNTWIKSLVTTYGFDAIRIDTVKHVRQNFWPEFVSASGVHAVGEVLDGDPAYIGAYQNNSMNSLFNYPLYYAIDTAFNSTSASMSNVVTALENNRKQFKDTTLLGNFVSNHDNPRFESHVSDVALRKNAIAMIYGVEGIPYVYYGQEQVRICSTNEL